MNLSRAQALLLAMDRTEHQTLRVRRARNEADVREMARAGLIEASLSDGSPGSFTCTRAITQAGRRFLRTFPASYRFCEAH